MPQAQGRMKTRNGKIAYRVRGPTGPNMHSGHSMKRQRGRGRKPGGGGGQYNHGHGGGGGGQHNSPNRSLETNGPDVKFRGTAAHIHERYLQLARDAASSGDRVLSENYMQHADHYFRLVRSMQPATPPPQQQQHNDRFTNEGEFEGDDAGALEGEVAEAAEGAGGGDDQSDAEFSQNHQQADGEGRRRRGRRNRFRSDGERDAPEGGAGPAAAAGQEQRRERSDEPRRERQPREPRDQGEASGPEGFSNGPKPAFLRTTD